MKNKRKIILVLLVTGIFVNISNNTSSNITHSANSFISLSDEGPIIGNHSK